MKSLICLTTLVSALLAAPTVLAEENRAFFELDTGIGSGLLFGRATVGGVAISPFVRPGVSVRVGPGVSLKGGVRGELYLSLGGGFCCGDSDYDRRRPGWSVMGVFDVALGEALGKPSFEIGAGLGAGSQAGFTFASRGGMWGGLHGQVTVAEARRFRVGLTAAARVHSLRAPGGTWLPNTGVGLLGVAFALRAPPRYSRSESSEPEAGDR